MTVNVPLSVNLALKAHCSFPAEQGTETHYFDFATFERYRHAILGKNFVGPIFENYLFRTGCPPRGAEYVGSDSNQKRTSE